MRRRGERGGGRERRNREEGHHFGADSIPRPPLHPVEGVLKGYDQLLNLVLDEAVEFLRGETMGSVW